MQDLRESVRSKNVHLSNRLIPNRIRNEKSEFGPPNCIYSYPECVLKYIGQGIL